MQRQVRIVALQLLLCVDAQQTCRRRARRVMVPDRFLVQLSLARSLARSLSLFLSVALSHSLTHPLVRTRSLVCTFSCSLSRARTLTRSESLPLTRPRSRREYILLHGCWRLVLHILGDDRPEWAEEGRLVTLGEVAQGVPVL